MVEILKFKKDERSPAEVLTKEDGSGKKYKKCHGA